MDHNLLYPFHSKNDMPQELHHPPRRSIVKLRVDNPLAKPDIIIQRTLLNLLSRDSELRAACGANLGRLAKVFLARELLLRGGGGIQRRRTRAVENFHPNLLGDMAIEAVGALAAWIPIAAKIHITVLLDEIELQVTHGYDIVMEWRINVPRHEEACTMGVKKSDGRGKVVVEIDYVREVGHGFVAFVEWGRKNIGI